LVEESLNVAGVEPVVQVLPALGPPAVDIGEDMGSDEEQACEPMALGLLSGRRADSRAWTLSGCRSRSGGRCRTTSSGP
jgi:hypothetical protein